MNSPKKIRGSDTVDVEFFRRPLNDEIVSVLGLLVTDGSLRFRKDGRPRSIDLKHSLKDRDLVDKVRSLLKSKHKVSVVRVKETKIRGKTVTATWAVRCHISNSYLVEPLYSVYGIERAKSFRKTPFPGYVTDSLLSSFTRGAWLGDGGFSISKHKSTGVLQFSLYLCGQEDYLVEFVRRLRRVIPISAPYMGESKVSPGSWAAFWKVHEDILSLDDFIHSVPATLVGARKKQLLGVFRDYLESPNKRAFAEEWEVQNRTIFMNPLVGKRLPDGTPVDLYRPGDYGKRILETTSWVLMDPAANLQIYATGQISEHRNGTISISGEIHHHSPTPWCGTLHEGIWTFRPTKGQCPQPPSS